MSDDTAEIKVGGDAGEAISALQALSAATKQAAAAIKEQFGEIAEKTKKPKSAWEELVASITGGKENIVAALAEIAAAYASFKVIKEAIDDTKNMILQTDLMSQVLGMSTAETMALGSALNIVGSSLDAYQSIVQRVTMRLNMQEETFKKAGVATRDSSGALLDARTVIQNTLTTLQDYKAGTDRNIMAVQLLGRSFAEASKLMRLNQVDTEALKEEQKALGLVVGEDNVQQVLQFNTSMERVQEVMDASKKVVSDALMPVLSQMGNWFADDGPNKVNIFKEAMMLAAKVIGGVVSVVEVAVSSLKLAGTAIGAFASDFYDAFLDMDSKAPSLKPFAQLPDQLNEARNKAKVEIDKIIADMGAAFDAINNPPTGKSAGGAGGNRSAISAGATAAAKKALEEKYAATKAESELEQELAKDDAQKKLEIASKFTDDVGKLYGVNSKQYMEAFKAEISALDAFAAQDLKMKQTQIEADKDAAVGSLNVEKERLKTRLDMGQINATQELAQRAVLEDQIYQIEKAADEKELALQTANTEAYAQQLKKLTDLEQKYNLDKEKLNQEAAKAQKAEWDKAFGSITQAFDQSIKGMIMGTQTLQKSLTNIWSAIAMSFLNTMVIKPATDWAEGLARQLAVKLGWQKSVAANDAASAAADAAVQGAANVGKITADSGVTFAGVFANLAPFMGPAAAGPAAASQAEVLSMLSLAVPSAAGGYNIPAGINPLVQTHAEEMILPKDLSNAVRGMAAGGGKITINTSGGDFIHKNDLASLLKQMGRSFEFQKAMS